MAARFPLPRVPLGRLLAALAAVALALPGGAWAHGDEVAPGRLASAWRLDPLVLLGAAVLLALVVRGVGELRRRGAGAHAGTGRLALAAAAVALGTLALVSPLDAVGEEYLLSAHMLQHVVIGDLAPALLVVALRGPLAFFAVPKAALRPLARLGRIGPVPVLALWAAAVGCWHLPALYDYALAHPVAHAAEHASFALAGTAVWWQLLRGRLARPWGVLGYALALFSLGMLLANALVLSYRPLYPAYAAQDERLLGLSPLADQQAAALVMLAEQLVTLGTLAAVLLHRHFRREPFAVADPARHPFAA